MYLAVLTRPDIAHSVSYLSQFHNSYSHVHWKYTKRILKLKTKDYCLKYSKGTRTSWICRCKASDATDRRLYTDFFIAL